MTVSKTTTQEKARQLFSVSTQGEGSPRGYKIQFRMFRVTKNLRRK